MSNNANESQGLNPAWKPLLDKLPDAMHSLVIPELQAWDKNFQEKLQEVRSDYAGFEDFKKAGINPELIKNSLYLYDQFATNPQEVIKEAIEAYELPFVDSASIQQTNSDEELEDFEMDSDITKHPQFSALMEQVNKLQQTTEQQQQQQANEEAVRNHMAWLEEMKKPEKYGDFDDEYVTALMSQGLDGEEAIKRYQSKFASTAGDQLENQQNQQQTAPPVVMGGDGNAGSGLPQSPINFGDMKTAEFNDTVLKMLEADQQNNNQG